MISTANRRGLIEAHYLNENVPGGLTRFPRRTAVASLKQEGEQLSAGALAEISTANRRGLIEATWPPERLSARLYRDFHGEPPWPH